MEEVNTPEVPADDPPVTTQQARSRGEALTWPIGAAFVVVLLLTYGAGVWWMSRSAGELAQQQAVAEANALADQLSVSAEPLLAAGELSAVRRLLSETALQNDFDVCQLTLTDGQTLVDADLSKPQMTVMPASWPGEIAPEPETRVVAGRVHLTRPVPVPTQGDATLHLEMPLPTAAATLGPALPGAGVIGVVGLLGLLLVYRKVRSRLGVLTMIRGALYDAEQGVKPEALLLDPRWSHEAAGWNKILERKQEADNAEMDRQLDSLGSRVGSGGPLEAGCDGLWQGLVVFDAMGTVAYANGAACVALRWVRDEAVGLPLSETLLDEPTRDAIALAHAGKGPARATIESEQDYAGGTNVLRHTVRPIGDGETSGALLVIEDITQQRVAETSRHDFVAQATHELRTPLTNIRMYLETAVEDGREDPELLGECLNVIGRESQRLERLVGEMLSVSEIEAGAIALKRDDVRLDALFKDIEADYAAKALEQQIELTFDLPPKLPVVQGDRDKLAVVLQNLMGNAVKYTPDGGDVRVQVEVSASELVVEVTDTGIGISEEDQERVFEKFTRANDPRIGDITGSGLGLALAQEITRLHGGELSVESVLNEGSTFKMVLPIKAEGV